MCHVNTFGIGFGDRLSLLHRLALSASFRHAWSAILSGATLCLYDLAAAGIDEVGVDDDFLDLGGHSLIAAKVVSRVGTAFGFHIPGSQLFEAASVSAMAGVVAEHLVRTLAPEARDRLFASLAAGGVGASAPAPGSAAQSAAAADAPAPAQ